jgi:formylglycine-generating enzyme
LFAQPEAAPRRKALVIGNEHYAFLNRIPGAQHGASAIAAALRRAKFDVLEASDVTLARLKTVIEEQFVPSLQPGDDCVVYYSGYGLQRNETNYFVPVDFDPNTQAGVEQVAYEIGRLQYYLNGKAHLQILLVEASWESTQLVHWAGTVGLATPVGRPDTIWFFDAARNTSTTASADGPGLFTLALLHALSQKGLTMTQIIQAVQGEVAEKSGGRQQPYPVGVSEFYFTPPPPPPVKETIIKVPTDIWPKQGSIEWNKDHQDYVYIPNSSFKMGCVPSAAPDCQSDEKPQHTVKITNAFWLGETEVQVAAYKYFAKQVAHRKMPQAPMWDRGWKDDGYPIAYVSWQDAQDYCAWAGGRLPTEAEWEYAARAGIENQVFPFADMKQSRDKANFQGKQGYDQYEQAAPVKKFDPNRFGLFDMAGNVWEWVYDFYDPLYYSHSPEVDPRGPDSGKAHVARGGSYASDREKHLRLSYRGHFDKGLDHVGFRCMLPDTPATRAQFKTRTAP